MRGRDGYWDALVITASNDEQAASYQCAIERRRALDLLGDFSEVVVVPDPDGRRIGSGGSTVLALAEVGSRFLRQGAAVHGRTSEERMGSVLAGRRVLVIHAGGDSRRLPAYAACGKAFIPVPGLQDSAEPLTLLDRQLQVYQAIPAPGDGSGQVVVASGDVLVLADPRELDLTGQGVVGTCCRATPAQASAHGVFCVSGDGCVRVFLQKPTEQQQRLKGAIDALGRSLLDVGLLGFDEQSSARLLAAAGFDVRMTAAGLRVAAESEFDVAGPPGSVVNAIWTHGLDIYREIACALGTKADWQHYVEQVRAAGSKVPGQTLHVLFDHLHPLPFRTRLLSQCRFLHFGTSRHVIDSGRSLANAVTAEAGGAEPVMVNCLIDGGRVLGFHCWIESCVIGAEVRLEGHNVLVGMTVDRPLRLAENVVLDVAPARGVEINGRKLGPEARFVRIYGVNDSFKGSLLSEGATYLNRPIAQWLTAMQVNPQELWDPQPDGTERSLWNAKLFPLVQHERQVYDWLWMQEPGAATAEQRRAWKTAGRFSVAEMAGLVDHEAESRNRRSLCLQAMGRSLAHVTAPESRFSAKDLARWLADAGDPAETVVELIRRATQCRRSASAGPVADRAMVLESVRVLHSLGSALENVEVARRLDAQRIAQLVESDLTEAAGAGRCGEPRGTGAATLDPAKLKSVAFSLIAQTMGGGTADCRASAEVPRIRLRPDEIVWARSPARLDLAGGWSDTPPYTLEYGGRVVNTAVCLNGQQPIHVYVRPMKERLIRIGSIDLGTRIEVKNLEQLLDYRVATSDFALVKASLALMGFSPETAAWPTGMTLDRMLREAGSGMEISTLCAIPKGSGLGTSSILGGTVLAALARALGRTFASRELFHAVLRLEQMLTTGGGWQDQVGGILPGTKYTITQPGMYPDPVSYFLRSDVLCPTMNGGCTLLYYTGITRVAKNILQQVVGRYLDRDRAAMRTLERIAALASEMRDALCMKDARGFGELIDCAWHLNKRLDPNSSCPQVESLLERIRPHIWGAKLLGAGGGGFLLIVCRSAGDADGVRRLLADETINERARFFEFNVSDEGLAVTTS